MKKTNRIKVIALLVTVVMLLQALGTSAIITTSAATEPLYETKFNETFDTLKTGDVWGVETKRNPSKASEPTVADGVMKFDKKDSVKFTWTKVDGAGAYSSSNKYVFEFDVKITNSGEGFEWDNASYTRAMYVAFGGWYNQIEVNNKDGKFRVGDTYTNYSSSTFEGKTVHYKVLVEGETITSYAYNADGSLISSGSRTSASYTNMTSEYEAMTYLVIRCEDGEFELDNFSFTVEKQAAAAEENSTAINVSNGKQAIYTAKLTYTKGGKNVVKFGSNELFSIADDTMKVCGAQVQGAYGEGEYTVRAYINSVQQMVIVEITLPDGGVVRRGSYDKLGGTSITITTNDENNIGETGVKYEAISAVTYELTETEPSVTGFGSKVYNLISSFGDATSDRLFAWTAKAEYVASASMELQYRVKGTSEWAAVEATKTTENTRVSTEDYFKAEIKDLKANTEYEYKIGKKSSTSEADWSEIYSFTTAADNVKDFSFIAIGDTQGYEWNHFKYAKAALEAAMKETSSPAFILNTGDIVDSGYEAYQWNRFFKALGKISATVANFVAIGNHDTRNAGNVQSNNNKNNYFSFYFNHPEVESDALVMDASVLAGLSASGKVLANDFSETVYSYNYGEAHFIVLNSGTYVNTGNQTYPDDEAFFEAQRAWLEKDLEANKNAKWTIIMVHEAMYHRAGGVQDRTYLTDVVEKYGVDLVIEGHSHLVTRTYPMKDGKIVTKSSPDVIEKGIGTIYMTIGATTTGHDSLGSSNVELMQTIVTPHSEQPVYTIVEIKGNNLILTTKQINGLVVDSFKIEGKEEEAADTTNEDTTPSDDAVNTEMPATENDTSNTPADAKSGCGAAVSFVSLAVVATLGTCTAFVAKKKEN